MIRLTPDLSEIVIVNKLVPLGENKVQGEVLIPESININLAQMGVPLTYCC